ncbi:YiiD C-terminal domain-containing protein [Alcanivorax sp. 1008]|uniref:YiiD C-terminal domain-containing protein n=1 Tax=Alcanivorax sp. 1008 TaxID=2816853 RepID=UPI001D88BD23|nr:YiiD C-terminal domain-containing protein [Alcanivorax sp. 1008]MCC1496344.1 YiiD C-terminal domain-containing protein [Alcanivorax sp. 1008]
MPDLLQLAARVREHIPLTRYMDFRLQEFAADQLILCAPLAPNINDKGTMFAGSQAALMALAGWCLTTLQAEMQLPDADVLAMQNSLRYQRPVTGELTIVVTSSAESLAHFRQRLARGERGVLEVVAEGLNVDGSVASVYQAQYMARGL